MRLIPSRRRGKLFGENLFPSGVLDADRSDWAAACSVQNCFLIVGIDSREDSCLAVIIKRKGIRSHSGAWCSSDADTVVDFDDPTIRQSYRTGGLCFVFPSHREMRLLFIREGFMESLERKESAFHPIG